MAEDPIGEAKSAPGVTPDVVANPSDEEVVRTLVEIEKSSAAPPAAAAPLPVQAPIQEESLIARNWIARNQTAGNWAMVCLAVLMSLFTAYVMKRALSGAPSFKSTTGKSRGSRSTGKQSYNAGAQSEAERLLQRLASGDKRSGDEISAQAGSWVGKVRRTPKTDQFVTAAINLPDMRARQAALEAELALDGIPQSEAGLQILSNASGNPEQRAWALWLIGALGNRGIDPVHSAKILESYLSDPDVNVRASAVNGLSLIATDETIPMLLDRFRNDPSPVVQERVACGFAESGMYTQEQRLVSAASFVNWLDDPLLTGQQRIWDVQALGDITGQHLGNDTAAWRSWIESHR